MRKHLFLILLFIMFMPFVVKAQERLTITYDANDGTGRTRVITYSKGNSYTIAGNDIFNSFNPNNDPMNDNKIFAWCIEKNCTRLFGDFFIYQKYEKGDSAYEILNEKTELTLYAKWDKRKDISSSIRSIDISGPELNKDENGKYIIEDKKDFEIKFYFKEKNNVRDTIEQLSYIKLPEDFANVLYDVSKSRLASPFSLPMSVYSGGTAYGQYYIKNDYLFIDFIVNNSVPSIDLHSGNLNFSITYSVSYNKRMVNNRELYYQTVSVYCNDNLANQHTFESYPTGNIIIKYMDNDSNTEIVADRVFNDIIGEKFEFSVPNFEGYKFINNTPIVEYEFKEESQVIILKYIKSDKRYRVNVNSVNETKDLNVRLDDLTQVEYEEEVNFKISPIKGYKVNSVKIIDKDNNEITYVKKDNSDEYSFIMPASDVTIIPSYERVSSSVNVEDNDNTAEIVIEVNDSKAVVYEDVVKFTIKPDDGYEVEDVEIIDMAGNKVEYKKTDNNNEYEFSMPDSNVVIKPIYKLVETPTVDNTAVVSNPNTSDKLLVIILLLFLSLGVGIFIYKKRESKYN